MEKHTLEAMINDLAKTIKRQDFQVAILYTPGKPARYAARLGPQPWLKDINPAIFLEALATEGKTQLEEASKTLQEIQELQSKAALLQGINTWRDTYRTAEPPF